ncbi:MAG TPA: hypothetical protein VHH92_07860 [Actinomycetota bacterium]|nr:hypothetical protein [Actinomycetota bacterium]
MSTRPESRTARLTAQEVARFTAVVALLAIFWDAAVGHGLTWENDPYWTYWVTKTFLIATVFGLGTAWFGIGAGRGAVITAVHTVVLTVYYWTFSPIGLPSSPEWLDLEHTWITGIPIHFGVIYLGYLTALWLWRRRSRLADEDSAPRATAALLSSVVITVVAGGIASLVLGDFPGVTWFLVRILLTVPFLLWWWAWAGQDRTAAVVGGVVLAFVWATYGQFLGPVGLPDTPLRIFDTPAPEATVEWLDYRQLWVVSFPIYLASMVIVLLLDSMRRDRARIRTPATALVGLMTVMLLTGAQVSEQTLGQEGVVATIEASGPARIETGDFYSNQFTSGSAEISARVEDMGGRVTPLAPHDRVQIDAAVQTDDGAVTVTVRDPLVSHPLGEHTTWWGVGLDVTHHGRSGIGTDRLPALESTVAVFGIGEVAVDGRTVARAVPVHVMTAREGLANDATLELDVGMEGVPIPGLEAGHLRVLWADHEERVEDPQPGRYIGGLVILAVLLGGVLALVRAERR